MNVFLCVCFLIHDVFHSLLLRDELRCYCLADLNFFVTPFGQKASPCDLLQRLTCFVANGDLEEEVFFVFFVAEKQILTQRLDHCYVILDASLKFLKLLDG